MEVWVIIGRALLVLVGIIECGSSLKCFSDKESASLQSSVDGGRGEDGGAYSSFTWPPPKSPKREELAEGSAAGVRVEHCSYFPVSDDPEVCFLKPDMNRGCDTLGNLGLLGEHSSFDPDYNLTGELNCVELEEDGEGAIFGGGYTVREVCVCNADLCNYSGADRGELFDLVLPVLRPQTATSTSTKTSTTTTTSTSTSAPPHAHPPNPAPLEFDQSLVGGPNGGGSGWRSSAVSAALPFAVFRALSQLMTANG